MSYQRANQPECKRCDGQVELIVEARESDVDGLVVRRALPSRQRRMVGPFVFFDHMGPAEFEPGDGIQVRPHPHIGLSTVTYLFEGEIIHRDSLGIVQPIQAEAVNLMTAGRGIVHSERSAGDSGGPSRLHGIQTWLALPDELQECEPGFLHYPAQDLPALERDGAAIRLIIGEAYGHQSPVRQLVPTLYLECRLSAGARLALPADYDEIGVYVVSGELRVDGRQVGRGRMAVASPGELLRLEADGDAHAMVIGGANPGPRHIWWNFVATTRERIEQAGRDWREGRFDPVPGDDEFVPLPD